MDKNLIRKQIRNLKNAVPLEDKIARSQSILNKVERTEQFLVSRCVLLYWSMTDEVYTHDFVRRWYEQKKILLPCVEGNDLHLRQYEGDQSMVPGPQFGIPEPIGEECLDLSVIDLMIVPGVAFDRHCNRMGRGRGFYDRLLSTSPRATKIGIAFDFQLYDEIPTDTHDIPMDCIISESDIIHRS